MTNLQEISTKLNSGQGTLGKLINDSQLHDELLAAVGDIKAAAGQAKDFMANAQGIVDQVKSGQGAIGVLVYDKQTADNLKSTVQNARDVSDKIARGEGTLGKLINDDSLSPIRAEHAEEGRSRRRRTRRFRPDHGRRRPGER